MQPETPHPLEPQGGSYATLDTDAIGSCRLLAACCGVVDFKGGLREVESDKALSLKVVAGQLSAPENGQSGSADPFRGVAGEAPHASTESTNDGEGVLRRIEATNVSNCSSRPTDSR